MNSRAEERQKRLLIANALIKIVSTHGRRFFAHAASDRVAELELDARNKVWWVDEHTQRRINTHRKDDWPGFSHGGTLLNLVVALRDYVLQGTQISLDCIAPSRADGTNVWGYDNDAAIEVRADAARLPVFLSELPQRD